MRTWMTRFSAVMAFAVVAPGARAQDVPATSSGSSSTTPGWVVTPSLTYATSWDDNVLIRGQGDNVTGDFLNVLNPRVSIDLNGRRGQIDTTYDGAFLLYRQFNTLDSFDQHLSFSGRRLITPHLALFANDTAAVLPTTDYVDFVGIPFIRTGSALEDARVGLEYTASSRMTWTGSYNFQWVRFDTSSAYTSQLFGGHSHGGTLSWRERISEHTSLIGNGDLQEATVGGALGFQVAQASFGFEQQLSRSTSVTGSGGVAHVSVSSFGPARTGPAIRVGLTHQIQTAAVDVAYSRTFVPSYGFGGTFQNEDFTAQLRLPILRRVYTSSSVTWRRDQPLSANELGIRSVWVAVTVGYAWQRWLHIEGFYNRTNQNIAQPGGVFDINRLGVQIVTSNPMRLR